MSVELLRGLPLFAGLPESDLGQLCEQAERVSLGTGETLIEEGAPGDALFVLLSGQLLVSKRAGAHDVKVDVGSAGSVIGEMSLVDDRPRSASVRGLTECKLLRLSRDAFERTLASSPAAAMATLHTVVARLRQNEALLHEKEKMAGLGTMAAGMAHELNNPAAAMRRAAMQLRDVLSGWQRVLRSLGALDLSAEQREGVDALLEQVAQRAGRPAELDPMTRSDREQEVEHWLEERGLPDPWELAPPLVGAGWRVPDLDALAHQFNATSLPVIVRALGIGTATLALVSQVSTGAERISEIVSSVKSYSYLDRAPVQEVDVREGLEHTLAMLHHKLAATSIRVRRDYAPDVPRVEAYAAELNQVWTAILDNAIDALGGTGEIIIRALQDGDHVLVEIGDNGPGIPAGIQSRVFEPFFTTKPPGAGVGLGLNIAYNVIHKHHGEIRLTSKPGDTRFQVRLHTQLRRTI